MLNDRRSTWIVQRNEKKLLYKKKLVNELFCSVRKQTKEMSFFND